MVLAARFRRVSGESQQENSSLEKQLERINDYCASYGYDTSDETLYTEVMTGVDWHVMPELQRMLKAARLHEPKFDVVVIDHPDRLARGEPLIIIMSELRYYGIGMEAVQQKIDETDEGKLVLHFLSYASKKEWERIIKRTSDGRLDRVYKKNKPLGSTPAYGYKWDDPAPKQKNRYVYNDDVIMVGADGFIWTERKVVEFIFQKAKEGMTIRKIAAVLTELGIPTRKGIDYWRGTQISKMLGDSIYIGKFYAFRRNYIRKNDPEKPGYLTRMKPLEEQYLMQDGTVPAIVDEETFAIVQRQLDYNKRMASRNNKQHENALLRGGLAICGHCNGHMNVRNREVRKWHYADYFCIRGNERYGKCGYNTIIVSMVDEPVWKYVCEIIRDPQKLKASIEALRVSNPASAHEKPIAERKQELEDEISSYVDLLHTAKSDAARKRTKAWITHLEEQLAQIEQEEKIFAGITKNWQLAQDEIKRFEAWCSRWVDKLETATYQDKRTCIEYLGIRVKIFRYGSKPRWKIEVAPPTSWINRQA